MASTICNCPFVLIFQKYEITDIFGWLGVPPPIEQIEDEEESSTLPHQV